MPKISIIVPVYNAESTLRKCLDSFIAQTLEDWELILVDDGTPDTSGQICDEYAKDDARFKVIHQQNCGVSCARQKGLIIAKGEYVIHADPDDWVEPSMLEELYNKACEDNADMVICDFFVEFEDRTSYSKQSPSSLKPESVLDEMFVNIHGSCCNKLVKRSCIDRYKAKFPEEVNYCEDVCFNVQLLKHEIRIAYLNKAFYHYVQSPNSITNSYTIDTLNTQKKYISFLSSCLPNNSIPLRRAKELVKKQAFRYNVLKSKDFDNLYPEIKSTQDANFFVRLMYCLAFRKHHCLANFFRKVYTLTSK